MIVLARLQSAGGGMDVFGSGSITALAELLKIPDDNGYDSDEDKPATGISKMGPGDLGGGASKGVTSQQRVTTEAPANTKDIWSKDEVPEGAQYDDVFDAREQPEYDMLYKQAVTSEDMFLQMGNKNPSTASCEDLVVKIKLPSTKLADIVLDVKDTFLDCRTAKYKLGLYLPHPVDAKNAKAQWDVDKQTLVVNLRLRRDYDFMNY